MTRKNLVGKRSMVASPWQAYLTCMPYEAIPHVLGALWLRSQKYWWETEDDQRNGRHVMNEIGVTMLLGCGKEIVDAINRVYMIIDRNENGTLYSFTGEGTTEEPYIISPPLPVVPPNPSIYEAPGSKWQREDLRDMLYNTLSGNATADYTNPRGTNPILEEILVALNAETNEETIALLQKIALALGAAL